VGLASAYAVLCVYTFVQALHGVPFL